MRCTGVRRGGLDAMHRVSTMVGCGAGVRRGGLDAMHRVSTAAAAAAALLAAAGMDNYF